MEPLPALLLYGLLIVAVSLAGGAVPTLIRITHRRLQISTSLVAGFLLAVAVLHLLPHAMYGITPIAAGGWALGGVLAMFLLQRFAPFHHHEAAEDCADDASAEASDPGPPHVDPPSHPDDAGAHHPAHNHAHGQKLNWPGVALGLTLHSLLGGVALGAAVSEEAMAWAPGVVVFLAILLHKPLDALTLVGVMRGDGLSKKAQITANALFSLAVPIGAGAFYFGVAGSGVAHSPGVSAGLAFSAGLFLCVALSDLLPEVHFHSHDRVPLTLALLVGVGLAGAISVVEHQTHHAHDHGSHAGHTQGDTGHEDHGHAAHGEEGHEDHGHAAHGEEGHEDHGHGPDGHGDHEHGGSGTDPHAGHDHTALPEQDPAHADHDHADHDHDHAGHDHSEHEHADHDHADHDHSEHDHAGHDHP
ncbi:MAG: ZIP family metal transporter [Planctomycetota bacterium]